MGDSSAHVQAVDVQNGLFAIRPDDGDERGKKRVDLWANYFKLSFGDKKSVLYIYDMAFKPLPPKNSPLSDRTLTVPEGKKLVQVVRCAINTSTFGNVRSNIATDFNKMLVSSKKLDSKQMETDAFGFWAENETRPHTGAIRFKMILQESGELCVSDLLTNLASGSQGRGAHDSTLSIIQALDVVIGHHGKMSLETATPKRGKCFPMNPPPAESFVLRGPSNTSGYLRGVRGFFASVRATTDSPLVNCNACVGAFYRPMPLTDLFQMFIHSSNPLSTADYKRLESVIRGLRVELTHLEYDGDTSVRPRRTIFGLAHPYGGPRQVRFYHEKNKRDYTVEEYWRSKNYGSTGIGYYPVLNVGNKNHPAFVPANVCIILPGQMAKKRLDATQTTDMIEKARRKPWEIRESINDKAFDVLGLENNDILNSFGISVERMMISVQGYVLKQPIVLYAKDSRAQVKEDSRWNLTNKTVMESKRLDNWGILRIIQDKTSLQRDIVMFDEYFDEFFANLKSTLGTNNVKTQTQSWREQVTRGDEDALKIIFKHCGASGIRLLVVVLPDNDASTYKQIKKLGDVDYGISTVCVLGEDKKFYKKPIRAAKHYFANVALKINLKLGGINHTLANPTSLYKTTMVIGIDVTHPSPGPTKKTAPSVAAMVASVDDDLGQWPVDLRINTAAKEMVDLLGPMLRTRLELWRNKHTKLPENLLIYRDGVSESQYSAVLQEEMPALRNTCEIVYRQEKQSKPKITLIIVGKRHHTRFFKKLVVGDNSENPEFGTVVDRGVTEARNWDFFLQSHHALIGTARPAHYFVLLNEIFTKQLVGPHNKISDCLHKLTYDMCWLFGRSTGPVSIPPPVYYADLACERSRCYGDFDDDISDTSSMTGDTGGDPHGRRGEGPLPYRGHDRPGPSNPSRSSQGPPGSSRQTGGSSSAASGRKEVVPKKSYDQMAGLSRKERNRLVDAKMAAGRKKAENSAKAEAEGQKPETKPQAKAEGKKPELKPEAKAEGKGKGTGKVEGKEKGKAEGGKPPEKTSEPGARGEDRLSKGQGKKPESKEEQGKEQQRTEAEAEAEAKKPKEKEKDKEKDKVEIHPRLRDTMFYV